jgi:hypothetical protein
MTLDSPALFTSVEVEGSPVSASGAEGDPRPPRAPRRRDRKDYGRARRRQFYIRGYDGPNGGFKTAAMVHDVLPTLDGEKWFCRVKDHAHTLAGIFEGERYVLANFDLYDTETGKLHPRAVRLTDWSQVLTAEHCDVLLDEVKGIAAARDNAGLPGEVSQLLDKLRHFDMTLCFTSPRFGAAHIDLRSVTQIVTSCRGFVPKRGTGRAWAPNRLANWRSFDTKDLEDQSPTPSQRDRQKVRARIVAWMWGPGSRMFAAYDTLGVVSVLAKTLPSGMCSVCGKRRKVEYCTCDHSGRPEYPALVLREVDGVLTFQHFLRDTLVASPVIERDHPHVHFAGYSSGRSDVEDLA